MAEYAELHAHSSFSFLDGASSPEELVLEASRLGLAACALTDHNGYYGVVRFAGAARRLGVPTIFGAEVTLDSDQRRTASPDPAGSHLVVLARDPEGYARLGSAIATAQLEGGEKGRPRFRLDALGEAAGGHLLVLTGCRKGKVPAALVAEGPRAAGRALEELVACFGREHVAVELWSHDEPLDSARNDALAELAASRGLDVVASANAHYATPDSHTLACALAAIRSRRPLDELDGWLPPGPAAHLRSPGEQVRRFARYPGAVERSAELGAEIAFDLRLVAPGLPPFSPFSGEPEAGRGLGREAAGASGPGGEPEAGRGLGREAAGASGPGGEPEAGRGLGREAAGASGPGIGIARGAGSQVDEMAYLRALVEEGGAARYGPRGTERVPGAWSQIDHELEVIEQLGFAGYFLVVWDLVELCRRKGIYCQGRGSAANSAVCYALRITSADAVGLGLLFERFLSTARDGPPDIDIDIESSRREEVIAYVYERHGRRHAAQVANVITYRPRSAVRDAARALGYPQGLTDRWSRQLGREANVAGAAGETDHRGEPIHDIPEPVLALAAELESLPRHLGVHSGGMVICDRPIAEVCPVEWATAPGRTVLQWDKEDCAAVGLVKFDLLGLGMLEALHRAVDLVAGFHHERIDLATIPQEQAVYELLCSADTVGVFQVESRAQMGTLPRLQPRTFYDLVIEVALIRPGPIQGGSVHPYLRRRAGTEKVTYPHPLLEACLRKTLGVPLFQEQLMQMAIDVAGFSPAEADQLRQAMGSKRSAARMEGLRERFYAGMAERGITGAVADGIYAKMAAFASFGFPESHSISFAYLVYSSAWLKLHYPAAFCAALLASQPMGFWSPRTLVADVRRHGVEVRRPEVNASGAVATLEPGAPGSVSPAVRLGLGSIRGLGDAAAGRIAAGAPYADLEDLSRRGALGSRQLEALATAGALARCGGGTRRGALWSAGSASRARPGQLPGMLAGAEPPALPAMDRSEEVVADLLATGISADSSLTELVRPELDARGVTTAAALHDLEDGARVTVAGLVTHRQRPETARGVTFVSLEDETGLVNVVCSVGLWKRYRRVGLFAAALVVRGRVEAAGGVVNVVAERLEELTLAATTRSRDFS